MRIREGKVSDCATTGPGQKRQCGSAWRWIASCAQTFARAWKERERSKAKNPRLPAVTPPGPVRTREGPRPALNASSITRPITGRASSTGTLAWMRV